MSFKNHGKRKTVSVGPWGGELGFCWDDGVYSTIRQLVIAHGAGVDSLEIEYDNNGTSVWSEKHGGNGGVNKDKVRLNYPDEFLTSVHGYYGSLHEWGPVFVRSLTFHSNKRTYGPYGVQQGTYFTFPISVGKIVGFHGRSGWYLDAIGVYIEPIHISPPTKSQQSAIQRAENYGYSIVQGSPGNKYDMVVAVRAKDCNGTNILSASKHSRQISGSDDDSSFTKRSFEDLGKQHGVSFGPWGGESGLHWDDGAYSAIRKLEIAHGKGVDSLKVKYDKNGTSVWSEKHGGSGGAKRDKVTLKYPDEFLTSLHGYYGSLHERGSLFVRSLTFHSNKRAYGPYGVQQGTYFSLPIFSGKIIGFHGKSGSYLDAIGVYIEPVDISSQTSSIAHSQQSIVPGFKNNRYSNMIQGSLDKRSDPLAAVRHNEEENILPPSTLWRQTSSSDHVSSFTKKVCKQMSRKVPLILGAIHSPIKR